MQSIYINWCKHTKDANIYNFCKITSYNVSTNTYHENKGERTLQIGHSRKCLGKEPKTAVKYHASGIIPLQLT